MILGSGPNRIGQGIEFDYCCVHASFALRDAGFETIMVNCNPETVSTDYDTSDRLYFEPLTHEDVTERHRGRAARCGVIVGLGGQTPLKLAGLLPAELVLGTSADVDRPRRGPRAVERAVRPARDPAARGRHRAHARRGRWPSSSASATRCWCARQLRARRPGHGDRLRRRRASRAAMARARRLRQPRATRAACRPSARCWSTASSRTPPRSTSTPSATTPATWSSAGSWSTSRRPACTRATRPASSRRLTCRPRRSSVIEDYTRRIADALDVRGLINVQYAVKRQPGVRHRGQPAGQSRPCRSWPRPPACRW